MAGTVNPAGMKIVATIQDGVRNRFPVVKQQGAFQHGDLGHEK